MVTLPERPAGDPPLILGGQGRTAGELWSEAFWACFLNLVAMAILAGSALIGR